MKNLKSIGLLLFAVFLAACNPRQSREMEAALEQAQAVYGDGSLEIEVDTVLFIPGLSEASAYFAGKKQYGKAALAALLNGYSEKDFDKEAAMLSFKEAEHYGEMAQDSITQARAEYWIGKLLYYEGMVDAGLIYFKKADLAFGTNFIERSLAQNGQAASFIMLCEYDSAEFCLKTSLLYIQNIQNHHSDEIECKVLNNYAVLYQLRGEYEKGVSCLRRIRPKNDGQRLLNNLNLGNAFALSGNADSADYYYEKTKESLENVKAKQETKAAAYKALCELAERKGDWQTALAYRNKYESALYKVMSQRQEQVVYRIQKQFDYEALQNAINQKLAQNQRIVAFVVVMLLCVVIYFLFRSARASKREALANANLFHFMQQNKALVESNMEQKQKATDTAQQLSDVLYARLYAIQKLDYCLKTPFDKGALKDLEHEVFGSGEHWLAVKEILVELYPGLWESLKLKYPDMDELELRVCMLSRLKLSRQAEATLLGISTSVLDKLRTKVRKTLEQDGNP